MKTQERSRCLQNGEVTEGMRSVESREQCMKEMIEVDPTTLLCPATSFIVHVDMESEIDTSNP